MRFVSLALLLMASAASAENWQKIGTPDPDGGVLSMDVAGVTEVKGLRRAWFKSDYSSDQPIPQEYHASVPAVLRSYRSEKTLRYFNCAQHTSAVMRTFWSAGDGKPGGYHYNPQLTFREAPGGSPDAQMLEAACTFTGAFADLEAAKLQPAGTEPARITRSPFPDGYYPSESRRRREQGGPVVQVCVDPSGKPLREPIVTESSGFPALDAAAIEVAKDSKYAAGLKNGTTPAESCVTFRVKFEAKKR